MKNKQTLSWIVVASMVIWGGSWPTGKIVASYSSVFNITFLRYSIVIVSLIPLLFALKVNVKIQQKGLFSLFASASLLAIYSWLFLRGLQLGLAGAGGVLVTSLNPIFAYSIGLILNRVLPSLKEAIGLLLGVIAGLILLKVWDNGNAILMSGNVYFLLASFVWATMSKITSKSAQYGHSLGFTFWMYVLTAMLLFVGVNRPQFVELIQTADTRFWLNMAYTSVISTSIATTFYFLATVSLGAEKASSFIFLVPLSAALSSWFLLGETIQINTIAGGVLGIMAVYMLNKK